MKKIDAQTKLCVLFGDPVEHSFSPLIHNAGFKELGLNFVYLAFQVKDVENAVKGMKALNIRGASVTIPHKVKAVRYVDKLDEMAMKIGSINTIVNQGGELVGYNSDGVGALKAFQDHAVDLNAKTVLVLGSGGAARAITFALAMNAKLKALHILGIIKEETDTLVDNLRKAGGTNIQGALLEKDILQKRILGSEIIINCTPLGMHPETGKSPVPDSFFKKGQLVFDVVYNPLQTKFLEDAKKAGGDIISGVEMFINQALIQFELWTGEKAPEGVMRKVVLESLRK